MKYIFLKCKISKYYEILNYVFLIPQMYQLTTEYKTCTTFLSSGTIINIRK